MAKVDVFQKFDDVEMRRMQAVYLKEDYDFSTSVIAEIAGMTVATIRKYIREFGDLLEKARQTFLKVTKKIKLEKFGGKQLVYLFKFYDSAGKLICSKVGTTVRLPETRINEEVDYYIKHGYDVADWKICKVIDCGDIPAEGAESITRAAFIRKFPKAFCKNDRFFGVDLSVKAFEKIVEKYLELEDCLLTI